MSRLQFRVWDSYQGKMLYDDFIIRSGNPISEELWYKISNGKLGEPYPYTNGEDGQYKGAEPMEYPKTMEQNDAITKIMYGQEVLDGASWGLVDYSNWYGAEHYITMQSTGFHDCTGHIIFEDDVLEKDGIKDSIKWNGYCYQWYGLIVHEQESINIENGVNSKSLKIVGNIYENQ